MKRDDESIAQYLRRRLSTDLYGYGQTIARETGIAQSTIGRVGRGETDPTLAKAEKILAWIARHDQDPKPRPGMKRQRRQREEEGVAA